MRHKKHLTFVVHLTNAPRPFRQFIFELSENCSYLFPLPLILVNSYISSHIAATSCE